jgi:2'-5' RNA ligase
MIRCFIAIELPEALTRQLAGIQSQLRKFNADVSWTKPEGIHLTLKFLGDVPDSQIPDIQSAMKEIAAKHSAFELSSGGVGVFPNPHKAKVLWIGVQQGKDLAGKLGIDLERKMELLGFPKEDRAFNPHLTLGRVKSMSNLDALMDYYLSHVKPDAVTFRVHQILLIQSVLKSNGAEYTPLFHADLK